MVEIPVGRRLVALVDDWTAAPLGAFRWKEIKNFSAQTYYAAARLPIPGGKSEIMLMHRFVMRAKPGERIDHRDGNGLNNQQWNLRKATAQQNAVNRGPNEDSPTGYKGVRACGKQFVAVITRKGKSEHLGLFDTPEEAAQIYNAFALFHDGEFVRPNRIPANDRLEHLLRGLDLSQERKEVMRLMLSEGLAPHEVAERLLLPLWRVVGTFEVVRKRLVQMLRGNHSWECRLREIYAGDPLAAELLERIERGDLKPW